MSGEIGSHVAVLTPPGRGAVASVVAVGELARIDAAGLFGANNGRPLAEQDVDRVCLGRWGGQDAEDMLAGEQVVACRVGSRRVELHCHGGPVAVRRIVDDLALVGFSECNWERLWSCDDHTLSDAIERDIAIALTRASTWSTAAILLDQQRGVLRRAVAAIAERPWADRESTASRLDELLAWWEIGRWLVASPRVVLAGAPNVGKSSLANALLGYGRAIVFDQPGTTRDLLIGQTAIEGWPLELVDMAGLRESGDEIEEVGVDRARRAIDMADLVVVVIDRSRPLDDVSRQLIETHPDALCVGNKSDLEDGCGDALPADAVLASALTGEGVDRVARSIHARLIPRVPERGTAVPVSQKLVDRLVCARQSIQTGSESTFRAALELESELE